MLVRLERMVVSIMVYKDLKPYNEFAKKASQNGGPERYIKIIYMDGFQKGVFTMIPVCLTTCVLMYKKGPQIMQFCKEKLHLLNRTDVKMAEKELIDIMERTDGIKKDISESIEVNLQED